MSWTNADGLTILMHEEQGEVRPHGTTVSSVRSTLVYELEDGSALTDATVTINANDPFIPADAVILTAT